MYMNDRGAGNQTVANFFADLKRVFIEIRGGAGKPQATTQQQASNTQISELQNTPQIPELQNRPPPLPPAPRSFIYILTDSIKSGGSH
jgi:hypothetical protein